MTRKHFILIAEAIAQIDDTELRNFVTRVLIPALFACNNRFKGEVFLDHVEKTAKELSVSK